MFLFYLICILDEFFFFKVVYKIKYLKIDLGIVCFKMCFSDLKIGRRIILGGIFYL